MYLLTRFFAIVSGATLFVCSVAAQVPQPLPIPNLQLFRAGEVVASVKLPDGSVVVGGRFTSVAGQPRRNIAKIQPDGALDPNWAPSLAGAFDNSLGSQGADAGDFDDIPVYTLAADSAGNVYAAGIIQANPIFGSSLFGFPIVKISPSGVIDTNFRFSGNSNIYALEVVGNALYVGGAFSNISTSTTPGPSRQKLAKIDLSNNSLDALWNPGANSEVNTIKADGAGNILAGGLFSTIAGQTVNGVAKLSATGAGAIQSAWQANLFASSWVRRIEVVGNDVFIGGQFFSVAGNARACVAKLSNSTGNLDLAWNPVASCGIVDALRSDGSGSVYIGGSFTSVQTGGGNRSFIAKVPVSGTGAPDVPWNAQIDGSVRAIEVSGAFVIVGGSFLSANAQSRAALARVSTTFGQLAAPGIDAERNGIVFTLAKNLDGSTILGGNFRRIGSVLRANAAKVDVAGNIDSTWSPMISGPVFASVIDSNGIYFGGSFGLRRVSLAGTVDWQPNSNNAVFALALEGSNLFVGGEFTSISGQSRNRLAKFISAPTPVFDPSWGPSADRAVRKLAPDGSGSLYIAGSFAQISSVSRAGFAKLSSANGMLSTWNPTANDQFAYSVLPTADGIFLAGQFSQLGGQSTGNRFAKVDSTNGTLITSFQAGSNTNVVYDMAMVSDGLLLAGDFGSAGGANRTNLAKLNPTSGAATPWRPEADNAVFDLLLDGSNVLLGGGFNNVGGVARSAIASVPALDPAPLATTSVLTASATMVVPDDSVELKLTANAGALTPTGSFTISNAQGLICSGILSNGVGRCTLPATVIGSIPVTAQLLPSIEFSGSTSAAISLSFTTPSPQPTASPALNVLGPGFVRAMLDLPDGSTLVAGSFTQLDGVARSGIAKLTPGGTIDPNFNPTIFGSINALAQNPAGQIYALGFLSISASVAPRYTVIRLNSNGIVDTNWVATFTNDSFLSALAADNNRVFVGGFGQITSGQIVRTGLAAVLTTTGALDTNWQANLSENDRVAALAIAPSGNLQVMGRFRTIRGVGRDGLARVSVIDGSVDTGWVPSLSGGIDCGVVDSNGETYLGGFIQANFSSVNIVKLLSNGSRDTSWGNALLVSSGGSSGCGLKIVGTNLYAGGNAFQFNATQPQNAAKLSLANGAIDSAFAVSADQIDALGSNNGALLLGINREANSSIRFGLSKHSLATGSSLAAMDAELATNRSIQSIVALPDGWLVGGNFTRVNGVRRIGLAKISSNGLLAQSWDAEFNQPVDKIALDSAGRAYLGGLFTSASGQVRTGLARITAAGTLDTVSWNLDGGVSAIAPQSNGDLYVGGTFASVNGQARAGVFKLNAADAVATWNANLSGTRQVFAIDVDSQGAVYLGGRFGSAGGQTRVNLAKLDGSTAAATTWSAPAPNGSVRLLKVLPNNDVLISGFFSTLGSDARSGFAKLSSTGALVPQFASTLVGPCTFCSPLIRNAIVQGNDVLVAGDFIALNGLARGGIAKLNIADGRVNTAFNPGTSNAFVGAMAINSNNQFAIGGSFQRVTGLPREGFAVFDAEVANTDFANGFEGQ